MSNPESLFIECWKAGIELSVNGDKLHFESQSGLPDDLLARLKEHKPEMLRFLSCWIETPHGQAKCWGFLGKDKCGVVLRNKPDRVTFIKRSELGVKPSPEDKVAAIK